MIWLIHWEKMRLEGGNQFRESLIHASGSGDRDIQRDILDIELLGFYAWLDVESRFEAEVSSLDH